jgi:hypothetical protein
MPFSRKRAVIRRPVDPWDPPAAPVTSIGSDIVLLLDENVVMSFLKIDAVLI